MWLQRQNTEPSTNYKKLKKIQDMKEMIQRYEEYLSKNGSSASKQSNIFQELSDKKVKVESENELSIRNDITLEDIITQEAKSVVAVAACLNCSTYIERLSKAVTKYINSLSDQERNIHTSNDLTETKERYRNLFEILSEHSYHVGYKLPLQCLTNQFQYVYSNHDSVINWNNITGFCRLYKYISIIKSYNASKWMPYTGNYLEDLAGRPLLHKQYPEDFDTKSGIGDGYDFLHFFFGLNNQEAFKLIDFSPVNLEEFIHLAYLKLQVYSELLNKFKVMKKVVVSIDKQNRLIIDLIHGMEHLVYFSRMPKLFIKLLHQYNIFNIFIEFLRMSMSSIDLNHGVIKELLKFFIVLSNFMIDIPKYYSDDQGDEQIQSGQTKINKNYSSEVFVENSLPSEHGVEIIEIIKRQYFENSSLVFSLASILCNCIPGFNIENTNPTNSSQFQKGDVANCDYSKEINVNNFFDQERTSEYSQYFNEQNKEEISTPQVTSVAVTSKNTEEIHLNQKDNSIENTIMLIIELIRSMWDHTNLFSILNQCNRFEKLLPSMFIDLLFRYRDMRFLTNILYLIQVTNENIYYRLLSTASLHLGPEQSQQQNHQTNYDQIQTNNCNFYSYSITYFQSRQEILNNVMDQIFQVNIEKENDDVITEIKTFKIQALLTMYSILERSAHMTTSNYSLNSRYDNGDADEYNFRVNIYYDYIHNALSKIIDCNYNIEEVLIQLRLLYEIYHFSSIFQGMFLDILSITKPEINNLQILCFHTFLLELQYLLNNMQITNDYGNTANEQLYLTDLEQFKKFQIQVSSQPNSKSNKFQVNHNFYESSSNGINNHSETDAELQTDIEQENSNILPPYISLRTLIEKGYWLSPQQKNSQLFNAFRTYEEMTRFMNQNEESEHTKSKE